jgi:hypothetical protein
MLRASLLAFVLGLAAVNPAPAPALQTDAALEELEVALWPEYDRPAVLVIYQARVDSTVELPATLELPIPAYVGEPHAVATRDPDGGLIDAPYRRRVEGAWATIQIETDRREIWLEYYDDLAFEGAVRRYNFTWPGGVAIETLKYEVQQPLFADEVIVSPDGEAVEDADGRIYIRGDLGPQRLFSSEKIELEYRSEFTTHAATSPLSSSGQTFERLEVAFWPEYDRSEVLVFYRVRLPQGTQLPTRVRLPIPADVGEPHAVAARNMQGALLDAAYQLELQGDWSVIVMEADNRDLWLEFYDDLVMGEEERSYVFQWPPGTSIGAFGFEVQQPIGAEGLLTSPAGTAQTGQDGFVYHVGSAGPQPADAGLLVAFQYSKASTELSVESEPAQPGLTRPQATRGGTPDLGESLPWFLGALGALALIGGALYYLRLRRPAEAKPRTRRTRSSTKAGEEEIDASPVYCHVCGTQASVSDRYCRRCGTQLRR